MDVVFPLLLSSNSSCRGRRDGGSHGEMEDHMVRWGIHGEMGDHMVRWGITW